MDPEQELNQLRARVAHLEAMVERVVGDDPTRTRTMADIAEGTSPEGFSRRRMLRNGLGLSAAAVAGVGMLDAVGSSAAAADGDAVTVGQSKAPSAFDSPPTRIFDPSADTLSPTLLRVDNATATPLAMPSQTKAALVATISGEDLVGGLPVSGTRIAILGLSDGGAAVQGQSTNGHGVVGTSEGAFGVKATSTFANAVDATTTFGSGVSATSSNGPGVTAASTSGHAIVATSTSGYALHATSSSENGAILANASDGFAVVGNSTNGTGVGGSGGFVGVLAGGSVSGVDSTSHDGIGVKAKSTTGTGLEATSTTGIGVHGISSSKVGVLGESTDDNGVAGTSVNLVGVFGKSTNAIGVRGTSGAAAGVEGQSTNGPGVAASSETGVGVSATSTSNVGAQLKGGAAAVRLVPQAAAGSPAVGAHKRGEMLVDSHGKLWLCTKAGTPGTWRQLAFV